jgi:hypothetical protein
MLLSYPILIILFLYVTFQPPWDLETYNKFIIHYTYGCDYNLKVHYFFISPNTWIAKLWSLNTSNKDKNQTFFHQMMSTKLYGLWIFLIYICFLNEHNSELCFSRYKLLLKYTGYLSCIDYMFLYGTTLNIYFIILRVNWLMVKLVSGDLTKGHIYEDLRQKTCPYLLQVFLKVWYVYSLLVYLRISSYLLSLIHTGWLRKISSVMHIFIFPTWKVRRKWFLFPEIYV